MFVEQWTHCTVVLKPVLVDNPCDTELNQVCLFRETKKTCSVGVLQGGFETH